MLIISRTIAKLFVQQFCVTYIFFTKPPLGKKHFCGMYVMRIPNKTMQTMAPLFIVR